jgi:PAS domain S-box-containing protein
MNTIPDKIAEPLAFIRGEQAGKPLNAAIVGAGNACYNLLRILDEERLARLNLKILGVSDVNPEAPGLQYARELDLFTTTRFEELFTLEGLNLLIELTGSREVTQKIFLLKPPDVSVIDHTAARLVWDLVAMEMEKTRLERERQRYQEGQKKHTQVILDSLPYRIMVVNMDMSIDTVNRTFLREFDVDPDDLGEMKCYEARYGLYGPCGEAGRTCFLEDRIQEIQEKGILSTIREYTDEKGETRFDVITIAPIRNERGEVIQLLEASRDVTDRVRLEREVEKSNIFFQNVIESTVDGIVVVDTKGNVLIFNEGMERLTGYPAKEIVEKGHLSAFYNIETARENMKKMRSDQYGPPGKLNPTSMTVTTKSGAEIPVTLSASIIAINGEEKGSVGVFTDMREVLKMRKDLEEAHLQLVQSEKIASVGRMAAGVAHEINNPLSGILIYGELLKESLAGNAAQMKDAQEIIDQTLRCKNIVSELLEFSRQTVGKVSSFPVAEMIDKSLNILINQAVFQDIEVIRKIQPDMPLLVGDMGQLQQVFTNLFINAADAMEGRGKLSIKARFDGSRNQFEIRVTDTGPGIPKELRDQIFDIFFTTKAVGQGTGLGLSISQNIIKLHGGSISVDCPPDGGTTFTLELPLGFVEQPEEEPLFVGLDG